MKKKETVRIEQAFLISLISLISLCSLHAQRGPTAPLAIVGARIVDGTGAAPLDDAVVVVEGDRIRAAGPRATVQVPRGAAIVDAKGKVLLPGLVDAHCHINQAPEDMKRYWIAQLRWGVTTMRSAGNDKPDRVPLFRQTRDGTLLGPRSYTAGQGFSVQGPYDGAPTFKPKTAGRSARERPQPAAQNVDVIKIWMTNPKFPPDVISAIVDEGKKQQLPVVAHVTDVESLRQLADQGVTDFLHTPGGPVTPELVAYAKAKKLSFAPTLANGEARWFYYEHPDILNLPMLQDALYPRGRQMLADAARKQETLAAPDLAERKARLRAPYPFIKAMSDAGVRIVVGTDCGAEASQITPFGHATHREMQMYVEAGTVAARGDSRRHARRRARAHALGESRLRLDRGRQGRGPRAARRRSDGRYQQLDQDQPRDAGRAVGPVVHGSKCNAFSPIPRVGIRERLLSRPRQTSCGSRLPPPDFVGRNRNG